ncbi:DUF1868 domain-containing protein [Brachyspira hampsonii]|uniref:DUF1868 domain-containing protein n=1 Tax=Brachyspira hampsonii TaxID=1287055 RepID=UPI0002AE1E1F|nr:DUF1868 domain-containing protein [Brachyspira hampsonii]ELV05669.1 hypothetical protein H263_08844 [Brachyspira hampsonii 30599]
MEKFTSCVTGEFKKFYPDGNARPFKGNTFICHIPQNSNFFRFCQLFFRRIIYFRFFIINWHYFQMTVII